MDHVVPAAIVYVESAEKEGWDLSSIVAAVVGLSSAIIAIVSACLSYKAVIATRKSAILAYKATRKAADISRRATEDATVSANDNAIKLFNRAQKHSRKLQLIEFKERKAEREQADKSSLDLLKLDINERREQERRVREARRTAILDAVKIEVRRILLTGIEHQTSLWDKTPLPADLSYTIPLCQRITDHAGLLEGELITQINELVWFVDATGRALRNRAKALAFEAKNNLPFEPPPVDRQTKYWIRGTTYHAYRLLEGMDDFGEAHETMSLFRVTRLTMFSRFYVPLSRRVFRLYSREMTELEKIEDRIEQGEGQSEE
ncbi:MAG TPA: hypothetical protein DGD08_02825 [Gemmatimonas aurantiaca]|uniref:DUF4760 domain-containing protein n=2 Tax=Gemmatimonas aurantiaca TaxID=173480 RepID=A0A3D4V744_9BACT|nr:hypothetical protein [Gemmatimonas aurantiaca]